MATTGRKYYRGNTDCPSKRHAPDMDSWRRGCTCETAYGAMISWAKEHAADACRGREHGPHNTAWTKGCRCWDTLVAHEEWKAHRRVERIRALAVWRETGQCAAKRHTPTDNSYFGGCRCPATVAYFTERHGDELALLHAKHAQAPVENVWRDGRMKVSRTNLWLLVRGFVDEPTYGERLAAAIILSQRHGPNGRLDPDEIGKRIGVHAHTVPGYFKRARELRDQRTQRRLADARDKAARVARALARRQIAPAGA